MIANDTTNLNDVVDIRTSTCSLRCELLNIKTGISRFSYWIIILQKRKFGSVRGAWCPIGIFSCLGLENRSCKYTLALYKSCFNHCSCH